MNKVKVAAPEVNEPRLSNASLVIDYAELAKAGLIVVSDDSTQLIIKSKVELHVNRDWNIACSDLATAGGYEASADRNMLFDAINQVEMRIRFAQVLRGEWTEVVS